ncbi:InlB B-repeat-containing protein, partial [Miniphocaeibacter massiliensis]|uniref:InlB B-repeat-containing protein n=1 Tax=Miniphocaeibacter massiliensis TaxID=2041841 RepID=UPI001A9178EC
MKKIYKNFILSLVLFTTLMLNQILPTTTSLANTNANLPKEPTEVTVTPSKYVPRIGEEIIFKIDNFGYENIETGIGSDYRIQVYNTESDDNFAQQLKKIELPEVQVEKYLNGEWINNGLEISSRMMTNTSLTGLGVEDTMYKSEDTQDYKVTRDNINSKLESSNKTWGNIYNFYVYFSYLNDNGKTEIGYANRLSHKGTADVTYSISDNKSSKPFATMQGLSEWYTNDNQLNPDVERPKSDYPKNWLYYETSDIELEVLNLKEAYEPEDNVKLKVTIKNTSENIPNTRLMSGLDFGEKDIVKTPVKTEGTPNVTFSIPEDMGSNGLISKSTIAPQESLTFETEITLPSDFSEHLNETKDKLVLTPFLYTSNIHSDNSGQKAYLHSEEREYNQGMELPIKKAPTAEYTVIFEPNGGTFKDGTTEAKQVTVNHGEKVKEEEITKKDSTFEGWFTDKELTKAYDFESPVTEDITLYAKWKANDPVGIKGITLIGGTAALSQRVENQLKEYNPKRLQGADRYTTAVKVSREY